MEQSESGLKGSAESTSKERTLQVLFEVKLSDDCSCPLSNPESQVENVHNQIDDGVCHAEVTVCDDNDAAHVVHTTNHTERSCLCLAFSEVGCVPRIESADGDAVLIETYVSDREVISELIDRLKSVAEHVSLRRLTARRRDAAVESTPTTVDLSHLTAKQREAATIAVSEGYYQTPRQTNLDDLAATLGISKSALSQRLSAVEAKLATAVFDP
ncbi:helix-turn-helix domain-containing protein [Haladaptatus sp. NG-SE-30]